MTQNKTKKIMQYAYTALQCMPILFLWFLCLYVHSLIIFLNVIFVRVVPVWSLCVMFTYDFAAYNIMYEIF